MVKSGARPMGNLGEETSEGQTEQLNIAFAHMHLQKIGDCHAGSPTMRVWPP